MIEMFTFQRLSVTVLCKCGAAICFARRAQGESRRSTTKVCYPTTCTVRAVSFMSNRISSALSFPPDKHFPSQSLDTSRLHTCLLGSNLLIRELVFYIAAFPCVLRLPNFHRRNSLKQEAGNFSVTHADNHLMSSTRTLQHAVTRSSDLNPQLPFLFSSEDSFDCKLHVHRLR